MLLNSSRYYSINGTSLPRISLKIRLFFPSIAASSNNLCSSKPVTCLTSQDTVVALGWHTGEQSKNASGRIVAETTQKFAVVEAVLGNKKCWKCWASPHAILLWSFVNSCCSTAAHAKMCNFPSLRGRKGIELCLNKSSEKLIDH